MTLEQYAQKVEQAKRIVFFGGAGVSTESGIPDFRSVDGLYNQKYSVPPEVLLSVDYFFAHTDEFYKFYFDKMIFPNAKPNAAHNKLAEWERQGKLTAVVTQNIDGLHQAAGSKAVFELHGSVHRNTCLKCGKKFALGQVTEIAGAVDGQGAHVPRCDCGGLIKPDVVLYGEALPDDAVNGALEAIYNADLLIVGGTSLSVYPAAGFLRYFRGGADNVVVINKTPVGDYANQLTGSIGKLL